MNTQEENTPDSHEPAAAEAATVEKTPRRRASRRVTTAAAAPAEDVKVTTVNEGQTPTEAKSEAESATQADTVTEPAKQPESAPRKRVTRSRKKAESPEATKAAKESNESPAQAAEQAAESADTATAGDAEGEPAAKTTAAQKRSASRSRTTTKKSTGDDEAEKPKGRTRATGRAGKAETAERDADNAEQAASADQGEAVTADAGSDAEDKSQNRQNDRQNGRGDSQRGGRTRQRDRKRRGSDDLEPELTEDDVLLPIAGLLDVLDNYAFVRTSGYLPGVSDVYVSLGQVKKYGLRRGDAIVGAIRQPREGEGGGRQKYNALVKLDTVNGRTIEENEKRIDIDDLSPVYPTERLKFSTRSTQRFASAVDRSAPMGLGQRALITLPASVPAAPLLAELASGVSDAQPEAHLMLVLTHAQPEAVTELQRAIRGEVISATFDRPAEDQLTIVELAIERARRLVELGHDVVLLIDSLSDAAQALAQNVQGGRGQADPNTVAIAQMKRLLAAARNVENGGSLTMIASVRRKSHVELDKELRRELKRVVNSLVVVNGGRSDAEVDSEASFTIGAL